MEAAMSEERPTVQEASRSPGEPVRRPLPLTRMLVALFGIGAGVWLWLGSGWAWSVAPDELLHGKPPVGLKTWVGRYVRVRGDALRTRSSGLVKGATIWVRRPGDFENSIEIKVYDKATALARSAWRGRVVVWKGRAVDTTLGRMNSTSIIALLIAVWGSVLICANIVLWLRRSCVPTATAAKPPAQPPAPPDDA